LRSAQKETPNGLFSTFELKMVETDGLLLLNCAGLSHGKNRSDLVAADPLITHPG
jgi:hypothetical protein